MILSKTITAYPLEAGSQTCWPIFLLVTKIRELYFFSLVDSFENVAARGEKPSAPAKINSEITIEGKYTWAVYSIYKWKTAPLNLIRTQHQIASSLPHRNDISIHIGVVRFFQGGRDWHGWKLSLCSGKSCIPRPEPGLINEDDARPWQCTVWTDVCWLDTGNF